MDAGWWSIVGWVGSALAVISLMQTRIVPLRIVNLIACLMIMAYHVPLGVWPTVVLNAVVSVINIIYLIRLRPSPVTGVVED